MDLSTPTRRRDFLANLLLALTVIPAMGVALRHVVRFLVPPAQRAESEVLVGSLRDLRVGDSRLLRGVLGNDLILIRPLEDEVRVFSSVCTHLGCQVQWDVVQGDFLCPCHMGRFGTDGEVTAGPPPAPLPSYEVRLDKDNIFVTVPVRSA